MTYPSDINNRQGKLLLAVKFPARLPTWNRILAINPWQRKKLRDLTDKLISISAKSATDSLTQTEPVQNTAQMALFLQEYYAMIVRKKLDRSAKNKSKSVRTTKRKL